jgi:secreted trypsin-like serine protease
MTGAFRARSLAFGAFVLASAGCQTEAAELKMQHIRPDFGASPKILGGVTAKRADWPATLVFTTDSGDYCTATVIGERVIITAAHCIVDNRVGQVTWNNDHIRVNCAPHDEYIDSPRFQGDLACHLRLLPDEFAACTADVALCVIADSERKFAPNVGRYERIRKTSPAAVVGNKVTLLGYGCTDESIKSNGVLSFGPAAIEHMSSPDPSADHDTTLARFMETHGVGVCNGDSGGAAYSTVDKKAREIIGINSRGNLTKGSDLVNVVDARIAAFLKKFGEANQLLICGVDEAATNCAF